MFQKFDVTRKLKDMKLFFSTSKLLFCEYHIDGENVFMGEWLKTCLVNVLDIMLENQKDIKKNFGLRELMIDSGGLQFSMGGRKNLPRLSPLDIFHIQKKEADWSQMFDMWNYKSSLEEWENNIKSLLPTIQEQIDIVGKDKFFAILHGHTIEQKKIWLDYVNKLEWNNMSLANKPKTFDKILGLIHYILDNGRKVEHLHLLAESDIKYMPIFFYLIKKYDLAKYLSIDISSPFMAGANLNYYTNTSFRKLMELRKYPREIQFPCECPFCIYLNEKFGTIKGFLDSLDRETIKRSVFYLPLHLHNCQYISGNLTGVELLGMDEMESYIRDKLGVFGDLVIDPTKQKLFNINKSIQRTSSLVDIKNENKSVVDML